jgi:hypothetical protein
MGEEESKGKGEEGKGEEERKGKGEEEREGGRERKTKRHPPARTFCASSLSRSMALSSDKHYVMEKMERAIMCFFGVLKVRWGMVLYII